MDEPKAVAKQVAIGGLKLGMNIALLAGVAGLHLLNFLSGPLFYQGLFMRNGGDQVDGVIPGPWIVVPFMALGALLSALVAALTLWLVWLIGTWLWPGRRVRIGLTAPVVSLVIATVIGTVWFHARVYTSIVERSSTWGLS
jgi:hypothetical protein